MTRTPTSPAGYGPLHRDAVYPLRVFQELTGLGHKGVATAKRQGVAQ